MTFLMPYLAAASSTLYVLITLMWKTSLSGCVMMRGIAAKWTIASIGAGLIDGLKSSRTVDEASALNTWPASVRSVMSVRAAESGNGQG